MATKLRLVWDSFGGGICAMSPREKSSYAVTWGEAYQTAMVDPIGRRGYVAQVSGLPGHRGLWTNVGVFRNPALARKACRLAIQAATAGGA